MTYPTKLALAAPLLAATLATAACTDDTPSPDEVEPAPQETRVPLKLVARYKAFLFDPDHTDASGAPLDEAWQVLREDRVNFHDRDVRQADDQTDPVFADAAYRDRIEEMVANGNLTEGAARKIVERNVLVAVDIYERGGEPERLDVSVY